MRDASVAAKPAAAVEIERLRQENRELRRHCSDLYRMVDRNYCEMCDYPCARMEDMPPVCELEAALRDLGVEAYGRSGW